MTDCARCGDCCTRIPFHRRIPDIMRLLADPYVAGRLRADLEFIAAHWRPSEHTRSITTPLGWGADTPIYECDAYDPATRLCTAHADRPPICRGYPWYGADPTSGDRWGARYPLGDLSPRCSYVEDVRPLLPIVSIRRRESAPALSTPLGTSACDRGVAGDPRPN